MAEFASGFGGAAGGEEFVFGPEGAADENGVCTGGELGPFAGAAGEAGSDKNLFAVLFEKESDGRLIGRRGAKEIVSDVVRIGAAQRDRGVEESRGVTRIVRKMAADAPSGGKGLPLDGRVGAFEDLEDAVLALEDALHGGRGKDEETRCPTQVKEAKSGVNFCRGQEDASNGRTAGAVWGRGELRSSEKLGAEIGRGSDEEPKIGEGGEGDLGLRPWS